MKSTKEKRRSRIKQINGALDRAQATCPSSFSGKHWSLEPIPSLCLQTSPFFHMPPFFSLADRWILKLLFSLALPIPAMVKPCLYAYVFRCLTCLHGYSDRVNGLCSLNICQTDLIPKLALTQISLVCQGSVKADFSTLEILSSTGFNTEMQGLTQLLEGRKKQIQC